jgi:hypothetical protein
MCMRRLEMNRLQELVRLHRMKTGYREGGESQAPRRQPRKSLHRGDVVRPPSVARSSSAGGGCARVAWPPRLPNHDALCDAPATAELFVALRARLGPRTLGDLP